MARARFASSLSRSIPRLAFRDNRESKTDKPRDCTARRELGNISLQAETTSGHVSRSQSFKTVFLGDADVGKTCLAKLFVERHVVEQTTNTIGFDHHIKEITMEGGMVVKLQVWDTAGMEQFRNPLVTKYYRNTDGIVFVFDLTRRETFDNLENWVSEVRQYTGGLESVKMVLVGNKNDKDHMRKVYYEEAKAFADSYGMISYLEVCAKSIDTLQVLDELFTTLAEEMVINRDKFEVTQSLSSHSIRSGIISLSDDWEVLEVPEHPIPHSVFSPQEASIRLRDRQRMQNKCIC